MTGCPACRVDHAESAVCKLDLHESGIIRIQRVFAHAFAFKCGEGFEARLNAADRADWERGEVEDMHADVTEHSFAAVLG